MSPMGAFMSKHGRDGQAVEQNVMNSMNHPEELAGEPGNFVAIAAGSGITPVIAIARTLLAANPDTRFDLVYANKAAMDVMFLEELADLKDKYPSAAGVAPRAVPRAADRAAAERRIDAEKLQALLGTAIHADDVDEWFLCGPFELVQLCRDTLAERGVEPEHVRFELFTTGKPDRPRAMPAGPWWRTSPRRRTRSRSSWTACRATWPAPRTPASPSSTPRCGSARMCRSRAPGECAAPAAPRWSPAR
jgi:ring-1,2-phenylacetyl-CoA epoxidase subunit PaaE